MKSELAWVDALLSRWGRWALRCESGALGFASCSILAGSGDGDGFDSAIPVGVIDDDMEAIDGAVRRLPKLLREVVMEVYQWSPKQSERKQALALGCHVDTMRKYLCSAQRKIALDISRPCAQNASQSVIGGSAPESKITRSGVSPAGFLLARS